MGDKVKSDDLFGAENANRGAEDQFLIVGLGASAGGIHALRSFFANVPADSGMAYVVILHLAPDHDSKLAEVLQNTAAIPVTQVQDVIKVKPNHVYVISPNQSLAMKDGSLTLSEMTRIEERRVPVDIFFRTLAESHHSRAISVVLSGTGANGSMGMKRVKECGGICIVQDPAEAEYSDMPQNSLATGLVDYVLPVAEIPARIISYKNHLGSVSIPVEPRDSHEIDDQALREIFTQLRIRTGHDFSNYKRSTVLRRIERRISVRALPDLPAYAKYLNENRDEARSLLKDLLISVTNFFRDPVPFEVLERGILLKLLENKRANDFVRVWVAGCATGEEAYSLAMLLSETVPALSESPKIQIFATDIDEYAVAKAREGYYTLNDAADVSPERLRRFFNKEGDGYRVNREIRELVLFASHNIIKDPPFSHLDLASCRNLLIYLNRTAQQRVLEVLHFALKPGGYLFLGTSESIEGSGDLFIPVDKESHIFRSRPVAARVPLPIPDISFSNVPAPYRSENSPEQARADRLSYLDLHQRLLEEYGPPSIVVNEDYDIVHLSPRSGRYLEFTGGEPSNNLLKVIRADLRLELRTALYQARQKQINVEVRGLQLSINNQMERVDLIVRPVLRVDDTTRGFILVLFKTDEVEDAGAIMEAVVSTTEPLARQLDEELVRAKAQLRATVEQYELQQEELKASNEELQAMNEELRSSTEELKTSKEELQSVNEELTTVNQELKIKIEELSQSNNDFQNLMNAADIGTIFLDRTLRVKLFTPRSRDIFNLIPADIGRPLMDITNKLRYRNLISDVEAVLERLQAMEREVETVDGSVYLMQIVPYLTSEDRISGAVVTFVNISEVRRAEEMQRWLSAMVESSNDAIISSNLDRQIVSWNQGAERNFGYTREEAVGRSVEMLTTADGENRYVSALDQARRGETVEHFEIRSKRKDETLVEVSLTISPIVSEEETSRGITSIIRDISRRKKAEDELRQAHSELESRVQERTSELAGANELLRQEVIERKEAERLRAELLRKIVSAQEDERRRMARDLHDQMGQQLTALRLKLESLKLQCDDVPAAHAQIEQIQSFARQIESDIDFLARELRPASLDDIGLKETLSNYIASWSSHFGIVAEFHSTGLNSDRLPAAIETNLYRIAQEALNNVFKHASTARVDIIIERRENHVALIVEDNGAGFAEDVALQESEGMGFIGMRERASLIGGTLEIESAPGKGTTVFVRVPISFIDE